MDLSPTSPPDHIVHIASGDLWGGAEAQLFTLLSELCTQPDVSVSAILLNHGELQQRLEAADIPVTVFPESEFNPLQLYRLIHRHLQQLRPQLVHTHRQKENVLGGIAAWRNGIPSLRTVHGAPEHAPKGWRQWPKHLNFALDRWVGRNLQQHLITVSDELSHLLARLYHPSQLVTIENGIDPASICTAAQASAGLRALAPRARHHVGLIGRLEPVKRVDLFLESARLLLEKSTDWHFHVLGEGRLRPQLEKQAAELGIAGQVTFHGHRSDIPACLAELDALVMCSDHEGLPMTALEALAVGTPLVAHAVGGLLAVLEEESGGSLVTTHNANAYASALQTLLTQTSYARAQLISAGQKRLQQRYTAEANANQVKNLYQKILSNRRQPVS